MRYMLVIGLAALTGCEAGKPVEEMGYAEIQQLSAEIAQRCTDMGLTPGSTQHQQCRQVEANKEIVSRRASQERQQRGLQAAAQSMQQYGQNMQQQAQISQSKRVNCTHTPAVGWGSATTTCY